MEDHYIDTEMMSNYYTAMRRTVDEIVSIVETLKVSIECLNWNDAVLDKSVSSLNAGIKNINTIISNMDSLGFILKKYLSILEDY